MEKNEIVVIVGAGPGGLSAAIWLLMNGYHNVVILEKKPEEALYKICAAGMSRTDYVKYNIPAELVKLIEQSIVREFDHFRIITRVQSVIVKSDGKTAVTIDRKKLNELMVKKARELGAKIYFGEEVSRVEGNFVITVLDHEYKFDFVIGADGSNSKIRENLGLEKKKEKRKNREKRDVIQAIQYIMRGKYSEIVFGINKKIFGESSYGWFFPWDGTISAGTGRNSLDAHGLSMQKLKKNLNYWIDKNINPKLFEKLRFEAAEILVDYKGFNFKNGKWRLVGDAGGFPNPATGGGIMVAVGSALDVVESMINPGCECQRIRKILKARKNSKRLIRLMAVPLFGMIITEILASLLQIPPFRRIMGGVFT